MNKQLLQRVKALVSDIIATPEVQQAIKFGNVTENECVQEYTTQITTGNAAAIGYYLEDCGHAKLANKVDELAQMFS